MMRKKNNMKTEYENAIEIIIKSLLDDRELWNTYKSNIAMCFKDEYLKKRKKYVNDFQHLYDIQVIANNAAEEFLKLLCKS